ncbi:Na(+)/H(+) antiporter subunit D [Chloroflexota bacterium]
MTMLTSLPPAAILIASAVILPILPRWARPVALVVFSSFTLYVIYLLEPGTHLTFHFLSYELVLLQVDRLSLAFGYVFALIAIFGAIYSFHIRDTVEQVCTLLYAGGALGVVFAGDLLTLYFFWEMMTWSSLYLIWARRTPEARAAGMRYVIAHLVGGSLLMGGILLHITQTGSTIFSHMDGGVAANLILVGFWVNAAIPPLHFWLSDSYPEGTVTGSVFLSAFTTKTAVYTLIRGFAGWEILVWAGAIMAVYGVFYAFLQNDTRRILAYHIVSQVGYMVCGAGLGTAIAVNGATAHAFAHVLYKGLLFMGAGTVLYATGRSKLTELGGLVRLMPLALVLYMIGAFSISGVPGFSGFVSKSVVIYAAEHSNMGPVVMLLTLASVGTFLSISVKLPYGTWFGPERGPKPQPVPWNIYLGMILTSAVCIAIGVYPSLLYNILPFAIDYHPYSALHLAETSQLLIFTLLGSWLLIRKLKNEPHIILDTDWFFRRSSPLVYMVFVTTISNAFAAVGAAASYLVRQVITLSTNPVGYISSSSRALQQRLAGSKKPSAELQKDSQEYDRPLVGALAFIMLLCFLVIIFWLLISA